MTFGLKHLLLSFVVFSLIMASYYYGRQRGRYEGDDVCSQVYEEALKRWAKDPAEWKWLGDELAGRNYPLKTDSVRLARGVRSEVLAKEDELISGIDYWTNHILRRGPIVEPAR